MFDILDLTKDNVIAFKAKDKIEKSDYDKLLPLLEKTEREGKSIKLFIEVDDIKGITGKALITDVATYFKHAKHLEKVAVVSEEDVGAGWSKIAEPFVRAEVKYFPIEEKKLAEEWIQE